MKKITSFLFLMGIAFNAIATNPLSINPGDTTWVHTNQVNLDYYGNFDETVTFPNGSTTYRKILMTCTLGQYSCPGNPQYCHDWDYIAGIELITPTGTIELGRFITPYAGSGWPRFGPTWQQPYVFDVTDFYPLLQGTQDIRIFYSGYSGGFTAKLSFAFIEGTPERNVLGVKEIYDSFENYGDAADPIENYFPTMTETPPAGTQSAKMKFIITGHGSDINGCCEFDSHYYKVFLNSSQLAQVDIWRDNCGVNDVYPQGGTWIYDRANWCPGAKVHPNFHELNITGGGSYQIDIDFENYTGSGSLGSYDCSAVVFYYGAYNKTMDAGITDIIAPTTDPRHYRKNPSGSIPKIKVHNAGSTAITSIDFSYKVVGYSSANHTWTGNIPPLEDATIELPAMQDLTNISIAGMNGPYEFQVDITAVNGQTDSDSTNNTMKSEFVPAPVWPGDIVVNMLTNNLSATGAFNQNPSDASWEITDMNGNVVASRNNATHSTQYNDVVSLPAAGFYKLKIESNLCLGIYWWAIDYSYPQYTPGYFSVSDQAGNNLPMHNYTYSGTPHDDWGCEYVQYFTVAAAGTAAIDEASFANSIQVYPNPATDFFNIEVSNLTPPYNIRLVNILGKTVYQAEVQSQTMQIPVQQFSAGMYFLVFQSADNQKTFEKVLVEK